MIRTLLFILLTLATVPVWADFEQDLSATTGLPQALRELRARADAGDADAQLNLGGVFFKGQDVEQDYAQAEKWFRLAALQGRAQAQFNLGMMYDTGLGVAQNHTDAARWYRLAADQGLAIAQLNLGVAYADGSGVTQNLAEAIKWLRLAATQGEAQAQFNLGVMYATGQGVKQDLVEAFRYAKLAADQGHKTAASLLADLTKQMTPKQQIRANATRTAPGREPATVLVSGDVYIQLGAFKSQSQAENHAKRFMADMRARLGDIGKPYSIFTADGWVRIQVGPYSSQSEAHRIAASLKTRLGYEPVLERR
jgi:TPR repeat protein